MDRVKPFPTETFLEPLDTRIIEGASRIRFCDTVVSIPFDVIDRDSLGSQSVNTLEYPPLEIGLEPRISDPDLENVAEQHQATTPLAGQSLHLAEQRGRIVTTVFANPTVLGWFADYDEFRRPLEGDEGYEEVIGFFRAVTAGEDTVASVADRVMEQISFE